MIATDAMRTAFVRAGVIARELRAAEISSGHLLFAFCDAPCTAGHALADLGVTPVLRAALAPGAREGAEESGRVRIPLARELKDLIEPALRLTGAKRDLTTADLLRMMLGAPACAGVGLLVQAGADPAAVAAALDRHVGIGCCAEMHVGQVPAALEEAARCQARLPGRASAAFGIAGLIAAFGAVLALVLAASWDTTGPQTVLALAAACLVPILLLSPVRLRRIRRVWQSLESQAPTAIAVPPALQQTITDAGGGLLAVRVQPGGKDRCFTARHRTLVLLSSISVDDREGLPFVLWHELAHGVRRDSARRHVLAALTFATIVPSMLTFDLRAMAAAVAGTYLIVVGTRWLSELSSDAIAVRIAGPQAMHAWAQRVRRLRRRRIRGLLTHPPLSLRLALHPVRPAPRIETMSPRSS